MPLYIFQNEKTGEIKEIIQGMNEIHEYSQDGIKWNRIFQNPQMIADSKIDPFDSKSFISKTNRKVMTHGDLQDISKELSEKREQVLGIDPVKENKYKEYSKIRGGKQHLEQKKEKLKKALKGNKHFELA